MITTQYITATEARKQFFQLLKTSYLENKTFIIEKGGIPIAQITPPESVVKNKKKQQQLELLKEIDIFRSQQKRSSDSVMLLNDMRKYDAK